MRKGKTVIYIVVWIAVLAVLSLFMKPAKITSCAAQQGNILVTGRSGYELPITYEEVTTIEYREELDYGTLIDGVDDGKEKSGQWENDELGQYLLCVNAKVKPCIILHTSEQIMVINYESQQSTQALYDALLEQIDPVSHPYPGSSEPLSTEGRMLAVTTRGFVDVDGVKLSAIQIQYNIDLTGAEIDKDTYSLEVYHGTVLENFGGGDIGDITGITISGDTVTLSVYADYHLSSETPFASAMAVSVTQEKDIVAGSITVLSSENAVNNYAPSETASGSNGSGGRSGNGGGTGGGSRGGGNPGSMMHRSGESALYGTYTIEGIEEFQYFTNNTSYGTPDGAPFHKDHCFSEITGEYSDIDLSYALYVPENYDPAKKYALVTVQNPAAREGTHPIESVLETRGPSVYASQWAQQYVRDQHPELDGLLVVVPTVTERVNDNGGTPGQYEAVVALWDYLIETYSIDANYIYGTGQSVGGMIVAETNRNRDNFFAGIWLFEDQWGQNYYKDSVFARGMMSDGYNETAQNTTRHYYRTDDSITWDYYFDSDGNKVFEDWDPYNYLYLISDDNILITNRTDNLLSNNTWQELAYLYQDTVGYELSHLFVDAKAPIEEQYQLIRAFLDSPDQYNGQAMGIRWVSFDNGANGYSCRRTDAGYEWLLSQCVESLTVREKLDINKPFEPAEVQGTSQMRVIKGYVDAQTGEPIYDKTAKAGSGTGLYNTCLLILETGSKAKADANPGWLPEGMGYPLTAGHIVNVTPIYDNGVLTAAAVEYDAEMDGLVVWLVGDRVINSRGEAYDDYFVTMEPFAFYDSIGAEIEARIVNAYVSHEPKVVPGTSKGEGTGRYVILELDTNFAGNELAVKQTAALRTDCVIAAPTTRLYSAEGNHK